MNFESLTHFCDVVKLNSFSKAAELHKVTQSTISQSVKLLEKNLCTSLIDRRVRPWRLTEKGEIAYREIRELVGRFGVLKKQFIAESAAYNYTLKVAVIYSVGLRHMNSNIKEFTMQNERCKVELACLHPDEVYETVRNGEAEIGIVSFPQNPKDFDITPWKEEKMIAVCSPKHSFAQLPSISLNDLNQQDFIHFVRGLVIRQRIDEFLVQNKINVNVKLEFDNIESIKRAVEVDSGVAILPAPSVDWEVATDTLKAVPLENASFYRPLGIIIKRGKIFPKYVELFINQLQNNANRS